MKRKVEKGRQGVLPETFSVYGLQEDNEMHSSEAKSFFATPKVGFFLLRFFAKNCNLNQHWELPGNLYFLFKNSNSFYFFSPLTTAENFFRGGPRVFFFVSSGC